MKLCSKAIMWRLIGASFVACVILVATPGAGFLFNNFVRGNLTGWRVHEQAQSQHWHMDLQIKGQTDFVHQDVALAPLGFSGWHSHPGPVFITVKTGTATWYRADNLNCEPVVYPEGTSFIEPANTNHYVSNLGSTDLELLTLYLVPKGAATREEQPQPSHCAF
jgi:quercetin dioxygenase-like cupin family protein